MYNNNLELRMYGLVPYQLMGIQKGIQYGHATDEFALRVIKTLMGKGNVPKEDIETYVDWLENWKTYIVLNGGTTNNRIQDGIYVGTLNNHKETLDKIGVFNVTFNEPDLGDQLTGVVFIVDERIFNYKKYPNFSFREKSQADLNNPMFYDEKEKNEWEKWVESIGGQKNLELRNFLSNFKLA